MIRRTFWLGLGALLGVAGYRRLARLARALTGSRPGPRPPTGGRSPAGPPAGPAGDPGRAGLTAVRAVRAVGAGTASFVRDIRVGMAEYLDASGEYMNRHAGR